MSELGEAIQILKVGLEGVDVTVKVGSTGIEGVQKLLKFLHDLLEYEKQLGKTSMKEMLKKGGDLQVFQFDATQLKEVEKYAKQYGILYSVVPRANQDGASEIIFHTEAVPRVNLIIEKLKEEMTKEKEKLKVNEKPKQEEITEKQEIKAEPNIMNMEEYIDKVQPQIATMKKSPEMEKEEQQLGELVDKILQQGDLKGKVTNQELQEVAQRIKVLSFSKNPQLVPITINEKMVIKETDTQIKTRIPYERNKYIWIDKEHLHTIHDGKTIITFLDKEKEYDIYARNNKVKEKITGSTLYEKHYDPVNAEIIQKSKIKPVEAIQEKIKPLGEGKSR